VTHAQIPTHAAEPGDSTDPRDIEAGVQLRLHQHVAEPGTSIDLRGARHIELWEQRPNWFPDDLIGMYYMG